MASYIDENIHICGLPEPDLLELDTVLYYGFGGYTVHKNDKMYYMGESSDDWDSFKTLKDIDEDAKKDPEAKWIVELSEPLSGAIWERKKDGAWVAISKNRGFA